MKDQKIYKGQWHLDSRCPRCGRWLRSRGLVETEKVRIQKVICGNCGFYEVWKTPLVSLDSKIVKEEVEKIERKVEVGESESESLGRRTYGRNRVRRAIARRIQDPQEEDEQ